MIIGKDTNFQANRNQFLKENQEHHQNPGINPVIESNRVMQHTNIMSTSETKNNAFSILEDRLQKGLITMEEFNKQCHELGKRK